MRTSRPVADKLGAVRPDPDLHGLLIFVLMSRATGAGRKERAARPRAGCHPAFGNSLRKRVNRRVNFLSVRISLVSLVAKQQHVKTVDRSNKTYVRWLRVVRVYGSVPDTLYV